MLQVIIQKMIIPNNLKCMYFFIFMSFLSMTIKYQTNKRYFLYFCFSLLFRELFFQKIFFSNDLFLFSFILVFFSLKELIFWFFQKNNTREFKFIFVFVIFSFVFYFSSQWRYLFSNTFFSLFLSFFHTLYLS